MQLRDDLDFDFATAISLELRMESYDSQSMRTLATVISNLEEIWGSTSSNWTKSAVSLMKTSQSHACSGNHLIMIQI